MQTDPTTMDHDLKLSYAVTDIPTITKGKNKRKVAAIWASRLTLENWAIQTERHVDREFVIEMLRAKLESYTRHMA